MTIEEQFTEIITKQKEDHLISFLKTLAPEQKKLLAASIKKISKEFSQFGNISGNTWGHIKGTDKQRSMLQIASFVCLNCADFEKSPSPIWFLHQDKLKDIINWYIPDWFSDYVNKCASLEYFWMEYDWIMQLTEKNALNPSKELVVKAIPRIIFENHDNKTHYKPENLLKRPITLHEHIWYLFELESNLHYSDRFLHFGSDVSKEKIGWTTLFKQYTAENRIDRARLLKEALLAANKNFNKVLSGWFAQLFTELEPTKDEILFLQQELFSVLSSPHSKPVNTSLQFIKKIIPEREFNAAYFLDTAPVLLSSDTKATVTSTLMILEKLAQKHKAFSQKICLVVCGVFIHADDELQTRAAKIIGKYGETTDEMLKQEITAFFQTLMSGARQLLKVFINGNEKNEEPLHADSSFESTHELPVILAEIPPVENTDDLVFLASHAFDNNESWHFDAIIAALVEWTPRLKDEEIPGFEPAFQRALNLMKNGLRSTNGHLDHLLACFFIDFGIWLIKAFPQAAESIRMIYQKYDHKDGELTRSWLVSPKDSSYTAEWTTYYKNSFFEPYKKFAITALEKIRHRQNLPLLSLPTHMPCWIKPAILIDRLIAYQQADQKPDDLDLQLAVSRCHLQEVDAALIQQAREKLSGEFKQLMIFLLDEKAAPLPPFSYRSAWMVASLAKKEKKQWPQFGQFSYYKTPFIYYTGQFAWESVDEEYTYNRYDYQLKENIPVKDHRKILRVFNNITAAKESGLKKIISKIIPVKDDPALLYDFLNFKVQYLGSEQNDIKRILSMVPNNPELLLAAVINQCLKYPTFWSETDKRMVTATLQMLIEIGDNYGEMMHLLIGTCMLASDKTVANIAAEIWIKAVNGQKIDNVKLGKVIGLHERIEFAPLKRFTDLVMQSMFRVSDLHNRELKILIENILPELPDAPIKNLKKLLEIYAELLVSGNSMIQNPTIEKKLAEWKKTAGLQKIAAFLSEKIG